MNRNNKAAEIFAKLQATRLYFLKRKEEALKVYPELKDYLEQVKDRGYRELRKELEQQLQELGTGNE